MSVFNSNFIKTLEAAKSLSKKLFDEGKPSEVVVISNDIENFEVTEESAYKKELDENYYEAREFEIVAAVKTETHLHYPPQVFINFSKTEFVI